MRPLNRARPDQIGTPISQQVQSASTAMIASWVRAASTETASDSVHPSTAIAAETTNRLKRAWMSMPPSSAASAETGRRRRSGRGSSPAARTVCPARSPSRRGQWSPSAPGCPARDRGRSPRRSPTAPPGAPSRAGCRPSPRRTTRRPAPGPATRPPASRPGPDHRLVDVAPPRDPQADQQRQLAQWNSFGASSLR